MVSGYHVFWRRVCSSQTRFLFSTMIFLPGRSCFRSIELDLTIPFTSSIVVIRWLTVPNMVCTNKNWGDVRISCKLCQIYLWNGLTTDSSFASSDAMKRMLASGAAKANSEHRNRFWFSWTNAHAQANAIFENVWPFLRFGQMHEIT